MKFLSALVLFLLARPAFGQDEPGIPEWPEPPVGEEVFGLRYRLWLAKLSGTVRSDKPAVPGTEVRVSADLGLEELEVFHDFGGWVRLGEYGNLRAGWWFGSFDSEETLDTTITFGGSSYSAGTKVKSDITTHVVSLTYEYPILPASLLGGQAQIFVQAGARYLSTSATIESDLVEETGSAQGVLPVLGAHGEVWLFDLVRADAELSGLILSAGGRTIRIIDFAAEVGVAPWKGLFAGIGYRIVYAFLSDESQSDKESELSLTMQGAYFTVGWRF